MNRSVPFVLSATALISACATVPDHGEQANARDYDMRTVDAVNQAAHVSGLEVHWINFPSARTKPTIGDAPALGEPSGT